MARILNFGSISIDHVYTVPHFAAVGETVADLSRRLYAGGKGLNQSLALAAAGADVYHAGRVGADGTGLVLEMEQKGVNTRFVDISGGETGHAIIEVTPSGENRTLVHRGANAEVVPDFIAMVLENFEADDILLTQNELSNVDDMLGLATQKGMRVALNLSPVDDALLACDFSAVRWFILNEVEGNTMTGRTEPEEILAEMRRRWPAAATVLTLGKRGVLYADAQGVQRCPAYDTPVVDTTGAGDTFTGYFLAEVARGSSVSWAMRLASIAAALCISSAGTGVSVPSMEQVQQAELKPVEL